MTTQRSKRSVENKLEFSSQQTRSDAPKTPLEPLPFTFGDLKRAIPAHCFKRSAITSGMYLLRDFAFIAVTYAIGSYIPYTPILVQIFAWPAFWYILGAFMTGLWVIAHECGHQAFSESGVINDIVGFIVHSYLLVPYFSWKYTHASHHKNTGSMENDEVFVPKTRSEAANSVTEVICETPLYSFVTMVITLTFGWPLYLIANAQGPQKHRGESHFDPDSKLFKDNQRTYVTISNVGVGLMLALLTVYANAYSVWDLVCWYVMPYLVVNYHLVLITFLQHTAMYLPHYREKEWSWLRGALATVDRNFSYFGYTNVLNSVFHHISETHVAHHLFSRMAFYHAQEATDCIKKVLKQHYHEDHTPIPQALWQTFRKCVFVEDEGDVVYFKMTS